MREKLLLSLFIILIGISFVSAEDFTKPGTYEIQKGDTITFNELTIGVLDIKTNDDNVSWNQDFGKEMVFLGTPGVGFYSYVNKKIEITRTKYSDEKPIAVIVNSIDLANGKAEVQFIDNLIEEINECENAGNVCQLHSCPLYQERVSDLSCPDGATKGIVCCRDKVYANIQQKITVKPEVVEEGNIIEVFIQLPTFRDCTYYLTNPSGVEKKEGGGGCGPTGKAMGFSTLRLNELFGTLESGTYQIKVIAEKTDNPNITLTENFIIGITGTALQSLCKIENGEGTCEFLNTTYNVKHTGCNNDVNLEFSYNGETELFEELKQGTSRKTLRDGIEIKLNSAPCAVYMADILFKKSVYNHCGDEICEVGEDYINCPEDCADLTELPELDEQQQPALECSTGCLYKTSCLSFGVRVGSQYCGIEGDFLQQKEKEEICNNNFECQSGICVDDMCVEKGLFTKFLEWLSNIFR